jgi:hypothetical protein
LAALFVSFGPFGLVLLLAETLVIVALLFEELLQMWLAVKCAMNRCKVAKSKICDQLKIRIVCLLSFC